jgi:NhaP-type Na+/H+ or K+/H+ antiporter
MEEIITFAVRTGWWAMMAGVVSGAIIGLFFHREDWMGGYSSYRRRLTRLGHISFFGLGFVNLFYGLSLPHLSVTPAAAHFGALSLLVAVITMPACCFLSAWRKPLRHLFPIPVLAAALGIGIILIA